MVISFFSPIAFTAMTAYMMYQTAGMASVFGTHMEKGKRRSGAMPNEAFLPENREATEKQLLKEHLKDLQIWTKSMPLFFAETRKLNEHVLKELTLFFTDAIKLLTEIGITTTQGGINILTGTQKPTEGSPLDQLIDLLNPIDEVHAEEPPPGLPFPPDDPTIEGTGDDNPKNLPDEQSGALDSDQHSYYKSIAKLSQSKLSNHLKLYAQKKSPFALGDRLRHPLIGARLLDEWNIRKQAKDTITDHDPITPKDIEDKNKPGKPTAIRDKIYEDTYHFLLKKGQTTNTAKSAGWEQFRRLLIKSYTNIHRKGQVIPIKRTWISSKPAPSPNHNTHRVHKLVFKWKFLG